jgi:hypothetical protein
LRRAPPDRATPAGIASRQWVFDTGAVVHLQVFWRAAVFGLAAYAVIRLMVFVSDKAGLLDWLKG